ncbi:uncharacterized protein LOC116413769 [Galleria mellonella]|uniref:Uncharacterized protein LOC116413769 n=1 Tax=Galleria mellonella TaxID=7137 RepID=A0A6J3CGY8_GALME|nr:uncharacterized protein LOC116413769 [Galleria mellonella]
MTITYVLLAVTALLNQAQSQICNGPNLAIQPVHRTIASPSINPVPLISTTLVDNSVANSLANTLQLLIVSELIESSLYPSSVVVPPIVNNIRPIYDAIGTIGKTVIDVAPIVEVIDIEPIYPAIDVIYPTVEITPAPVVEITSNVVSTITEVTPVIGGVTEIIKPFPNHYGYTEIVAPVNEIDIYTTVTEVVNPLPLTPKIYGGFNEITTFTPGYLTEVTEVIAPVVEVITPLVHEVIAPAVPLPLIPEPCGVIPDHVPPPGPVTYPAEIMFPTSAPAHLRYKFPCHCPMPHPFY